MIFHQLWSSPACSAAGEEFKEGRKRRSGWIHTYPRVWNSYNILPLRVGFSHNQNKINDNSFVFFHISNISNAHVPPLVIYLVYDLSTGRSCQDMGSGSWRRSSRLSMHWNSASSRRKKTHNSTAARRRIRHYQTIHWLWDSKPLRMKIHRHQRGELLAQLGPRIVWMME